MTLRTAARSGPAWLRCLNAGTLAALLCLYAIGTSAANADEDANAMNLAPSLSHDQPAQVKPAGGMTDKVADNSAEPLPGRHADVAADDAPPAPLRLEHMLLSLEQLVAPQGTQAGALARTPSLPSILKFLYWFALLLLSSLTMRDTLRLFRHLLSRPPAPQPSMPHAPWPSMTVIFESHSTFALRNNIAALADVDYPAERLKIIVLCPLHDADILAAAQSAAATMPGRVLTLQSGTSGDVAGRCFSAGIRFGNGEIVLVLSDTRPCPRTALKACAERFFDPSLGALLGFLPGAAAGDRALAPRMANLLRIASQTAGMTSTAGMTPGTGLLALRRTAVRTAGMDATRATDCFALLRQLERFGSHHTVQEGITAAGNAVHNWEGRSRWIDQCARAFAATMPLNPLRWLGRQHVMPINFGMHEKLALPALWVVVATGSIALYVTGNALAAAIGLAVCTATAYSVDGMPSAFNCTAVLFRVHGRRAEASLAAWAPVIFCHDLMVAARGALQALLHRMQRRHRDDAPPVLTSPLASTRPIDQSTTA